MTADRDIDLVLSHLNLANQIDERLNKERRRLRINTTQMLVLALLSRPSAESPLKAAAAKEMAAQLQRSREMVSIQIKGLADDALVERVDPAPGEDRRWKRYRLTKAGERKAEKVVKQLALLDAALRSLVTLGLDQAHLRDMQRLVEGLKKVPLLIDDHVVARLREKTIHDHQRETAARNKTKYG